MALSKDEMFDRLRRDGQPGLVRGLEFIAEGGADILLVSKRVGVSDDPVVQAAVAKFVTACGAEIREC